MARGLAQYPDCISKGRRCCLGSILLGGSVVLGRVGPGRVGLLWNWLGTRWVHSSFWKHHSLASRVLCGSHTEGLVLVGLEPGRVSEVSLLARGGLMIEKKMPWTNVVDIIQPRDLCSLAQKLEQIQKCLSWAGGTAYDWISKGLAVVERGRLGWVGSGCLGLGWAGFGRLGLGLAAN